MFQKKYENWYMAKLWRPYNLINKREVNRIIKNYGKKPYIEDLKNPIKIPYDEFSESYVSLRQHGFRGNSCYQIAIYSNQVVIKRLNKKIQKITKQDLIEFKNQVDKLFKVDSVFVSDNRFKRMRLNKKWLTFSRIQHNQIHRIISRIKKRVYRGVPYEKAIKEAIPNLIRL